MSISEYEIKNSKKQLDFYKELCEVKDKKIEYLKQRIDKAIEYLKETSFDFGTDEMIFDKCNAYKLLEILKGDNNAI